MAMTMAARGGPSSSPSLMPGATGMKSPRPPLPPRALGFVNGGRKRRSGGAQRARAHGGAEDRDDVPVPFREAVTPSLL